jgi:hypothetical protein
MAQRMCPSCEEDAIQRKQVGAKAAARAVSAPNASHVGVIHGGGQPLSATARGYFEPRFGADFSNVRVHTDAEAADSASALNALAYTTGADIVFGPGQFLPESARGRRLLAHELTHVIQQRAASTVDAHHETRPSVSGAAFMRSRASSPSDVHVNQTVSGQLIQRVEDPCNKHYKHNCERFKCIQGEREDWCTWSDYRELGKRCYCPLIAGGEAPASTLGMAGAGLGSIVGALTGASVGMLGGLPGMLYGASEGMEIGADVGGAAGGLVQEGLEWLFGD